MAATHVVAPKRTASRLAIFGWVLFDWAAQPFHTLIITFIYAPYFAAFVVGEPTQGQALWGVATGLAGVLIAIFSPIFGAIADETGHRKPWIAAFGVLIVIGSWALWFGKPQAPDGIAIVMVAFVVGAVGAEFATVFNNAMMPTLVPPRRLGWLSGLGWGTGYIGGLVALVLALAFLAGQPETGRTLLGYVPLFGLDPAAHEGDRATGPFTALWFILFVLPLFLFTPDAERRMPLKRAIRSGIASVARTFQYVQDHRNTMRFLIANMIYADGLIGLFAFGGIYAAGTLGWRTIEVGIFGILLTAAGAIGAILGGRLDDRFGPKPVILGALALLILAVLGVLSIERDKVLFVLPVAPAPEGTFYGSVSERLMIALGILIGLAAGPLQAASRTLLARLAPMNSRGQFFGLFALSGRLTSFVAPFLVATVTALTASQRAGVSVLVLFFVAGALVLLPVSGGSGAHR